TSRFAFDYWLTILGPAGAVAVLTKNLINRSTAACSKGEWLLFSWGVCYISFLVYMYGLVDYRYIMPVQYVLPFFLLSPFLWLQNATAMARVPYRIMVGFGAVAVALFFGADRVNDTLKFLDAYRSEGSVQPCYDV